MRPSEPRSNGEPSGGAATPNEAISLPQASLFIHNAIAFQVGFGRAENGGELVQMIAALPPMTLGGHEYLEQLALWMGQRLAPAITRGRIAVVELEQALEILEGIRLAGGADGVIMDAGGELLKGWADRWVQWLIDNAGEILERAKMPQLGDVGAELEDLPAGVAMRSPIGETEITAAAAAVMIARLEREVNDDAAGGATGDEVDARRSLLEKLRELTREPNPDLTPRLVLFVPDPTSPIGGRIQELEAVSQGDAIEDLRGALEIVLELENDAIDGNDVDSDLKTMGAIRRRLTAAIAKLEAPAPDVAGTIEPKLSAALEDETPAEHVANSLMIVRDLWHRGADGITKTDNETADVLERRLSIALAKLTDRPIPPRPRRRRSS